MMGFFCERPYMILAAFAAVPAAVFVTARVSGISREVRGTRAGGKMCRFPQYVIARTLLRAAAWIFLMLAAAGISFGSRLVPVAKSGSAVSFVFDISNSMTADDGPGGMTRLAAASAYARTLLSRMEGIPVSAVIVKGRGITAVPLTEDHSMINSLLDVLSPEMMTAPGSGIGDGILTAAASFPENYSSASRIWVFTDGEDTLGGLTAAFSSCAAKGIPVTLIGFGSRDGTTVTAGDGKTKIHTSLRTGNILAAADSVLKKMPFHRDKKIIQYVDSSSRGSAYSLLAGLSSGYGERTVMTFETEPVSRRGFFLVLALVSLVLSFAVSEADFSFRGLSPCVLVLPFLLAGCGGIQGAAQVLGGAYSYQKRNYTKAASSFLSAEETAVAVQDRRLKDYALYGLGCVYAAQNENSAAMEKFSMISEDASAEIRGAAFYNAGIIAFRDGDYSAAAGFFRKSLEADSSRLDAKINMELSADLAEESAAPERRKDVPSPEKAHGSSGAEDAVFRHIEENDRRQWKNSMIKENQTSADDY